ncbi:MAG TPA: hypothetical protein VGD80_25185, partial [Kofleriaceae bacterium]
MVIVRRRIGTPPTGNSVFGVSSEYGRNRVAHPAARITAFIGGHRAQCNPHAHTSFSHLSIAAVQLSPDRLRERLRSDQFLSPHRHHLDGVSPLPVQRMSLCVQVAMAMELDAVVLSSSLSRIRIAGVSAEQRAVRVARRVGAARVLVVGDARD